jgi:hypothetical protein
MEDTFQPNLYKKTLAYWAVFMVLYFAYKFVPNAFLAVFCGIAESNFQHFKATFFSWVILSVIEYVIYRRKIGDLETYFYSRMGTATLLPWFMFVLWYLAPAFYGQMPNIPLEIIYANIITVIVGVFGVIFERGLAQIRYFKELKIVLWTLFLASIALYMIFTFVKLPWADVFVEPDWR